MPKLRGLGQAVQEISTLLLNDRLMRQREVEEQEEIKQRQLEVANYNKDRVAQEGEENRKTTRQRQYGENPSLAFTASVSGNKEAEPFIQRNREIMAPAFEKIAGAKNAEDLPSLQALFASRKPGIIDDLNVVTELGNAHSAQNARIADTISTEVDQAGATSQAQAFGSGMGKEEADAQNFPAVLGRKGQESEQDNKFRMQLERGLNPIFANRAGSETLARLNAEYSPAVVKKKLDYETEKAAIELVKAGNHAKAVLLSNKKVAVEGLMPTYLKYRQLALDVVNSPAGAQLESVAGGLNAISKVPIIGEMLGAGIEAGHSFLTGAATPIHGDPELSNKVSELNRLTDTLAQGMANAVLGNRGQTTENDRRTAKNILVNSFTSAKTAQSMLAITDQMFALLPSVAAANPDATPAQILQQAADAAQAQAAPETAAPRAPQNPRPRAAPVIPPSVQSILSR